MSITRRRFLQGLLAAELAQVTGLAPEALAKAKPEDVLGFDSVGNLTLLFVTDLHAHLRPIYFREPSVNMGPPGMADVPGHLGGAAALKYWGIKPGAVDAYFASSVAFEELARRFGRMGGVAH
ncbi:MAG: thiosulfohydrolase SoxB, partial [Nitrospinae bacterium]|nr:thiosulfohydrolase SoxB [Nitrospinota bacterium]